MINGVIDSFRGKYGFLSNFYSSDVEWEGLVYSSSEAAFQAGKCLTREERLRFTTMSPKVSKSEGKRVSLRPDWETVKVQIMYDVVKSKFSQNEFLKNALLDTGNSMLIEGNIWHDRTWGVCRGVGENYLGKILMLVRKELRGEYVKYK